MTANELRTKYLKFFESKGHTIIPSASLVPENDPTVLFTTAGMHPLVPYLMGENHPGGSRVTSAQKCIRTGDIDEVGDTTHHTFFEMLGNWSFGDYFKKEAIEWSYEFLTSPDYLGIDKNRIAVSVFAGDEDAPFDEEAFEIWKNLGIPEKRIAKLPKKNNWWGPAGTTGPCGPDTEMFYWVGDADKVPEGFNDDNALWVEIWNDVFMQYNKNAEGKFEPLKQKNVDTGMGLERTLAVVNGHSDNYTTEIFVPIIKKIEELSGKKYGESQEITKAMRIIADHIKAATFIMGDNRGVAPSNTGQGYVVRRLIRRAVRYGAELNSLFASRLYPQAGSDADSASKQFNSVEIAKVVIDIYKDAYPELLKNKEKILNELKTEEEKFGKQLNLFIKEFNKMKEMGKFVNGEISGSYAFYAFTTWGFPVEMLQELALENNLTVDTKGFEREMQKHQELSRTASAGMFKGGLADAGEETKKLHTAAHLMLAALRKVLPARHDSPGESGGGEQIIQKGSNITAERLRFDFSYPRKLTEEEIKQVEDLVNEKIKESLLVVCEEMGVDEAKQRGATGVFDSKYGEKVKVYSAGEFSKEICGGPHVNNTNELGIFKITKEEASSAGVRRIKAVLT